MKRTVLGVLGLALVLSLGITGCEGGSDVTGAPKGDLTPAVKLDPKMTDMTGASFADQRKAAAKNTAAQKEAGAPAEKK
jgi:hypothetical protein